MEGYLKHRQIDINYLLILGQFNVISRTLKKNISPWLPLFLQTKILRSFKIMCFYHKNWLQFRLWKDYFNIIIILISL